LIACPPEKNLQHNIIYFKEKVITGEAGAKHDDPLRIQLGLSSSILDNSPVVFELFFDVHDIPWRAV
jgi:hypothetical protein